MQRLLTRFEASSIFFSIGLTAVACSSGSADMTDTLPAAGPAIAAEERSVPVTVA